MGKQTKMVALPSGLGDKMTNEEAIVALIFIVFIVLMFAYVLHLK